MGSNICHRNVSEALLKKLEQQANNPELRNM
jgi:hypothetical protein